MQEICADKNETNLCNFSFPTGWLTFDFNWYYAICMRRKLLFICLLGYLFIGLLPVAHAQNTPVDLASVYAIADGNAVDGDILMYQVGKGLVRANESFSPRMFGVLQNVSVMVYRLPNSTGKPVVRSGTAYVNVSSANGAIKSGDYITSSSNAGKGQKASESGYVLGVALGGLTGSSGKIPVAVRIEYAELTNTRSVVRLLDYFNVAAFQSASDPNKASQLIKYAAAGLLVLFSLAISFVVFGRSMGKGIEAIGRNPLARNAIQVSIILNAVFTIGIVLLAITIAYFILRL